MSDPYLDSDLFDDELTDQEADAVDPLEVEALITQGLDQIGAELHARQEQEFAILKAQTAEKNAREAFEAMDAKYGDAWKEHADAITAGLRVDYANGKAPFDAQELAERAEAHYIVARERSKPTKEQENRAYVDNIMRVAAENKEYGF